MGEKKFYICKHCGNMIGMIKSSGVNVVCCGDPMTELKPNTVEASQEKHLPVVTIEGNIVKVKVGSVEHPMTSYCLDLSGDRTGRPTEETGCWF